MANTAWTNLTLFPLALGGNVFGWTADETESFAVLDAYAAAGGNHIDTADSYSAWVPGNSGGESETIIGNWMKARGNRDQIMVATKAGRLGRLTGANIATFADASLRRLQSDYIDLFYMHDDHSDVPLEESLGALDALVRAGKVRAIAASNFTAARLAEAREVSAREGFAAYVALQPYYNLVERRHDEIPYEGPLQDYVVAEHVDVFPFFSLAMGFLAGKYRPGGEQVQSARAAGAAAYLETARGPAVLTALDQIAAAHQTNVAAVALAWTLAQPGIAAPIASARTTDQLAQLLPVAELRLAEDELAALTQASELE
ncbi:aldo/keto reductase [Conexibacter sp. JD483]|uniref:aldo/keto reductase n=1 Tax=unclassified Conexibacter TaxID=2627773 RepID=UPI0027256E90|nr:MULTISPECIES: aldo/keto reductase [unclassified Conexibacter]MDO8184928.1 aldo/keto reductase [Conexibacter sp. CPCC 205706]MDO8198072.1 aldo/keto reductase [Conexibacter sp. CPCC 205762]MDR9371361.1 aldo/keto reductase [Conexibacter sp. JD483]